MSEMPELLAAYDAQVRDRVPDPLPNGVTVERDGPLVRFLGLAGRGFVVYRDLAGLEGDELGELIARAAWIRFELGTEFATLWAGATLPEWRRRGIYRATVAHRANLTAERGFRYLEVDASDDSRPILERLGFRAVTTTTPYVWSPPGDLT